MVNSPMNAFSAHISTRFHITGSYLAFSGQIKAEI